MPWMADSFNGENCKPDATSVRFYLFNQTSLYMHIYIYIYEFVLLISMNNEFLQSKNESLIIFTHKIYKFRNDD